MSEDLRLKKRGFHQRRNINLIHGRKELGRVQLGAPGWWEEGIGPNQSETFTHFSFPCLVVTLGCVSNLMTQGTLEEIMDCHKLSFFEFCV